MENRIEIFTSPDGKIRIEVQFEGDSFWLSLNQIAGLFGKDNSVISRHLKNIYREGELIRDATVAKIATVQAEGNRKVTRELEYYNLDAILSVGYRVNSKRGTQFRQWTTQRLREYFIEGISLNEKRLEQKNKEVEFLHDGIRILSRIIEEKTATSGELTWLHQFRLALKLIDDYDNGSLDDKGKHAGKAIYPAIEEYMRLIEKMHSEVCSGIFGLAKDDSFYSAVNQIEQKIENKYVYPTIEEKAAMLLYLIVKNHAFIDGNKRIAAACFLFFLERNGLLKSQANRVIISNETLASLTIFVAASQPDEMETVKKLIISILNRGRTIKNP